MYWRVNAAKTSVAIAIITPAFEFRKLMTDLAVAVITSMYAFRKSITYTNPENILTSCGVIALSTAPNEFRSS
jgi:uncharacterized membrane protein